jgi:hypothetical protein
MGMLGFIAIFLLPIAWIANTAIFVAMIYMIYNAYIGKQAQIPYFTENLYRTLTDLGINSWFDPKK